MTDEARRWLADARSKLPERDHKQLQENPIRRRVTLRSLLARKPKEPDR